MDFTVLFQQVAMASGFPGKLMHQQQQ